MIVGFDHLARNFNSIEKAKSYIKLNNYEILFQEKNIPNHYSKKNELNSYSKSHTLFFCKHNNGFKLENTIYGNFNSNNSNSFDIDELNPRTIKMFSNAINKDYRILKEILNFKDNNHSKKNNLNFNLILNHPISSLSCSLELKFCNENVSNTKLDSLGFTCLCFLSSSIDKDMFQLKKYGVSEISDKHKLVINSKEIIIHFFRFPGGALSELIQPYSKKII